MKVHKDRALIMIYILYSVVKLLIKRLTTTVLDESNRRKRRSFSENQ